MQNKDLSSFNSQINSMSDKTRWQDYVLTPSAKEVYPESVKLTFGDITFEENILKSDYTSVHISYPLKGEKPYIIIDMGPASCGGYPVFKAKAKTGIPIIRVSYADSYDHIIDETYGETGDFNRGTCTYLGVELPILPANPYRYELYTISDDDIYMSPLIQGQQRWVRIQLDTPGTSVDLEWFRLDNVDVYDNSTHDGYFLCNDDDLNRVWYASTWTLQMAIIPNSNAWATINGWLAPRWIECGNEVGLYKSGNKWCNYSFDFDFKISRNPDEVSAIGWVFRANDEKNCYIAQVSLNNTFNLKKLDDGISTQIKSDVILPITMVDNKKYHISLILKDDKITTYLNGLKIDETTDCSYIHGTIGFYQPKEKWAFVCNVHVIDINGKVLLKDDFGGNLDNWSFDRTLGYVADGAKRDRLLWSGDLDWACRSIYYGFKNSRYMKESIQMMAFNQTPEGYVNASPYPGNNVQPVSGDFGPFPSDEFSAWFVPVVGDYLLYTGDITTTKEVYGSVKKDIEYLWGYVDETDGLFSKRYETSKHINNLNLGDTGKYSYINILLYYAVEKGRFIADKLGFTKDVDLFSKRAEKLKQAIMNSFWSSENGCFVTKLGGNDKSFEANALAMMIGFVNVKQAETCVNTLTTHGHGKIEALSLRGQFKYDFDKRAMNQFRAPGSGVNWIAPQKDWRYPHTVWECMPYPEGQANGSNWGDKSHPDTAVADIFSAFILGVRPTDVGYSKYVAIPQVGDLKWAEGKIPTPYGDINFSWTLLTNSVDIKFTECLTSCSGTVGTVGIPTFGIINPVIRVNGVTLLDEIGFRINAGISSITYDNKYIYFNNVKAGTYKIELISVGKSEILDNSNLSIEDSEAPIGSFDKEEKLSLNKVVNARTSVEALGWGKDKLVDEIISSRVDSKGYSSEGNSQQESNEWIEFDLGSDKFLSYIKVYPIVDVLNAENLSVNFPVDFTIEAKRTGGKYQIIRTIKNETNPLGSVRKYDLFTVIGNPSGRYLKINVSKLGLPSSRELGVYRLQLEKVEVFFKM